jgi:hypothetical protein
MNDIAQLATTITAFLAPHLPTLLKKIGEEVAKQVGTDAWRQAKAMWSMLFPKMGDKAVAAAEDVASDPEDEAHRTVLVRRLNELLAQNPTLVQELSQIARGDVVQSIIARHGSEIHGLEQRVIGSSMHQEAIAEDNSKITGAKQISQ